MNHDATTQDQHCIYSEIGHDPDLRDLVEDFVKEMPYRTAVYEELFLAGNLEELRRAIHQLKGAAGSYGYPPITDAAATLEKSIRSEAPYEEIRQQLERLIQLCHAARVTPQ